MLKAVSRKLKEIKTKFHIQTQKELLISFEQAKQNILEKNSRYIIEEKLVPYIISDTLYKENYLMSEKDAYKIATQLFIEGKQNGKIDELNRLVKEIA